MTPDVIEANVQGALALHEQLYADAVAHATVDAAKARRYYTAAAAAKVLSDKLKGLSA